MTRTPNIFAAAGLALTLLAVACTGPADERAREDLQTAGSIEAGAGLPPDHPPLPQRQDEVIAAVDPAAGTGARGLVWDVPPEWIEETPANSMRRAQYRVPATGGEAGTGECVVFYFGPGQGGDAMSNAVRWAAQFVQPDGTPSAERMTTEEMNLGGIAVLRVEVSGTYQSGSPMMGGSGELLPDYMLLGAVASGSDANWFFKFTGPRKNVEENRSAFDAMLGSLRAGAQNS